MEDLTIYTRLDSIENSLVQLEKSVYNITQALEKLMLEIKKLENRICEDDCK